MRKALLGIVAAAAFLSFASSVSAEKISNAQYIALSAKNAADLQALEQENELLAKANVNMITTARLKKVGVYNMSDLFVGTNGFFLPGWAGVFMGDGGGGDDCAC